MSGYIDNREVSEQLADHADAILRKPFSTIELRERVSFLLDQRSAPDETSPRVDGVRRGTLEEQASLDRVGLTKAEVLALAG